MSILNLLPHKEAYFSEVWNILVYQVIYCITLQRPLTVLCSICLDKQIKAQSVKNGVCGMQRGSSWIICCAALAMPLADFGRAVTPARVSGVCQDTQVWPIHSVLGSGILWGQTQHPWTTGSGKPYGNAGKNRQGSVWGGLMWAVCLWCLCSHICIVSRCYLTHPLLISSELLIFHKHCANPPGNTIDLCHRY